MPDAPLVYLVSVAVVFAVCAWAGWEVAGRRARKPDILPERVWLCDRCKSFNDPTHLTCYRCHEPRPVDATYVTPDPEFHVDQQLGRQKGSTQLGASSPWLAGEEPLRDAWLTERARASEQALEASEPAPAFWTGQSATAEPQHEAAADVERDPTSAPDRAPPEVDEPTEP
jgi:hypothetical protein